MKRFLITIVFASICFISYSQDQNIDFKDGSFEEIMALAKQENKPIFMDCYTVWCGPCKQLAKNVFPQPEVSAFFNENFISIKMDMEKGEGIELAQYYNVNAYPTLLFLDSEGNVLKNHTGSLDAKNLIETGRDAIRLKK
ncbi:thioredoxin family protein [Flavivirga eckloniae]|uniref:Thioredoxin domain-containing protein n=1 Tax=Flavivirga eckloniae TaxID=1803846 RepID=A0A2K9PTX5_9FLAO|nr:thioredoxin fold domain-containing protein [Flavivirga eckloniae]AUP80513.1 hypothetical protein C1H87_18065 [Flavivirga eckloniae]